MTNHELRKEIWHALLPVIKKHMNENNVGFGRSVRVMANEVRNTFPIHDNVKKKGRKLLTKSEWKPDTKRDGFLERIGLNKGKKVGNENYNRMAKRK